ncbi:NCS1 nucleoside transporter [Colletotrichum orchidophilum]|uniref:NCS1 nucleoside transporter n=1 Tax=Colletotrichum orchidophilum TaxID=1209926 RepID=A0A1G4BQJ8_9PEZI|nr:NCS1 nucleoside transporter [Colletotrichum orchidophilum]OHF03598.1 NCS1 nucleoside transporter [Colletotrichum orchidophilum]
MWSQSDDTRYARKPGDQVLDQLIMVSLRTIIVAWKLLWQPYAFLDAVHENEANSGARAEVAFANIAFTLSQISRVVASNCVVAGIDLATLLARWFTIRCGGYFAIVLCFVMSPVVSAQQRWQFCDCGRQPQRLPRSAHGNQVCADYVLTRKRAIKLTDVYGNSPASIYWYTRGWNWRVAVSWLLGACMFPG